MATKLSDGEPATPSSPPAESMDAEPSTHETEAEHEHGDTSASEQGVTLEQYKAFRNICDILTNHKIKIRGDE